ncbi:MAG: hypothetical protein JSW41_05560 [Candidatus Aenigmatarchaeota archaeon]|nr:MAG: hypothetical protein JSW41_05560 [Candidatus Aenigmarchaeota archaeon]
MYEVEVEIEGIRPLLQHRFPDVGEAEKKSKKKTGSIDYSLEAEKSAYRDEKGNLYQPSTHIEGALVKGAVNFQITGKGKKTYKDLVKATVFVEPEAIPHEIQDYEIDSRPVVIQRARVVRYRPRLDEWKLKFKIQVRDDQLPKEVLKEILEYAGNNVGIGDYRPRFGTFMVTSFKEVTS